MFALSNPTSNAECTAEEAYALDAAAARCSRAAARFRPVSVGGKRLVVGPRRTTRTCFPASALGAIACRAPRVTDEMFAAAARTLADMVSQDDMAQGLLFPPLPSIREVSFRIAVAVAQVAWKRKLTKLRQPKDLDTLIRRSMFEPVYPSYI